VDKDPLAREFTVDVLEFCINRSVMAFDSGREAWKYIQKSGNAHIIITEVDLPGMTGLDLLANIKKSFPDKTCIIMSQSHSHEKQAEELGADAFLAKPFYVDEIFEIVQRYVIQP
jgi:YesN/AraC family two-component response regulator